MADEIKQRVKIEGAEEATAQLKRLSQEERELGHSARKGGDDAEHSSRGFGMLGRAWDGLKSSVSGLVIGAFSINTLTSMIRANTEAMKEAADAANRLKEAQLDLQFLSQDYNPQELALVKNAALRRGGANAQIEMSGAYAELKSKTPDISDDQRAAIFAQLVESSLTTSASPMDFVALYARGSDYVQDPERLQNLIRKSQELSPAASPSVLGRMLPGAIGIGNAAGLTPEQSAGLLNVALKGNIETGATSTRNILLALSGKGTPEGNKLMDRLGIDRNSSALDKIFRLAASNLSLADVEAIGGRESSEVLNFILNNPDVLQDYIGKIEYANSQGLDLTKQAIQNIYSKDTQQELNLATKQADARKFKAQAEDVNAQRAKALYSTLEARMIERGVAPMWRAIKLGYYDSMVSAGADPFDTAMSIETLGWNEATDRAAGLDLSRSLTPNKDVTIIANNFVTSDPSVSDSGRRKQ